MALAPGKKVVIKSGTTVIGALNNCSLKISSDAVDITQFGDDWVRNGQVLKSWSASISGFLDNQGNQLTTLLNALTGSSPLSISISYTFEDNTTITYTGNAVVTDFSLDASVDNYVELSVDLTGTGALSPE